MAAADPPRIAAGEPVALALGAGGARGLAQIGVIEALQARGLNIVAVAGSSSGALIGGVFAAGKLDAFATRLAAMTRGEFLRLMAEPSFANDGLVRGDRLVDAMREVVGDPLIETLDVDFVAVAVDLVRQREVWLRSGPLWQALRASFAFPGVFTPGRMHGRDLVDGGLLAPMPIPATRLSDAHRLIAVDMHGFPQRPTGSPADPGHDDTSLPQSALGRWMGRQLDRVRGEDDGLPGMRLTEVLGRSVDIMQGQIARVQMALDPPELVIRIPRDACQFYEFWRAAELIEIGRREAEKALDAAGY
ncbi:MAG: patatin-like phospholipase family protein [Pseudomonadota bacterium]